MSIDYKQIGADIAAVMAAVSPLLPSLSATILIASKVVQGVSDSIPAAIQFYDSIVSGKAPTAEELAQFQNDYEEAYQQLKADIAAALAKS